MKETCCRVVSKDLSVTYHFKSAVLNKYEFLFKQKFILSPTVKAHKKLFIKSFPPHKKQQSNLFYF